MDSDEDESKGLKPMRAMRWEGDNGKVILASKIHYLQGTMVVMVIHEEKCRSFLEAPNMFDEMSQNPRKKLGIHPSCCC